MGLDRTGSADPLSLHGVIPPTVTAFHDDESVDYETTAAHARFVVDRGVHSVFSLGTNGEFALLDAEERAGIVEAVVDEIAGDVPVIAGVGEPSTSHTVKNAERAADAGVDGIVVVTPYYYPLDHDSAVEHYQRVTESVDLPTYVYHIPSRTGNHLSQETLGALADIDGVAGLKDSSEDVSWLAKVMNAYPELTFLIGSDSLQLPGRMIGCAGGVSAVANAFPELLVDLHDSHAAGDVDRARDLQSTLYDVQEAFSHGPSMASVKAALSLRGFDAGPLRSPLQQMSDEQQDELENRLLDFDVL